MLRKERPRLNNKNKYPILFCLLIFTSSLAGCASGAQSPDFLLLNSYFPSWLIGSILALVLTVVIRFVFVRSGVDDYLPFRFFVYVAIWLVFSMALSYFYSPR